MMMTMVPSSRAASFDVGTRNLAVCVVSCGDSTRVDHWELLDLRGADLCASACRELHALMGRVALDPGRDVVVVERQPGRNLTMVRVEAYLRMFFADRGFRTVAFHARHKLEGSGRDGGEPEPDRRPACGRAGYEDRKRLAVQRARREVEHDPVATGVLDRARKKDDLADALLQGLAYLRAPRCAGTERESAFGPRAALLEASLRSSRMCKAPAARAREQYTAGNIKNFLKTELRPGERGRVLELHPWLATRLAQLFPDVATAPEDAEAAVSALVLQQRPTRRTNRTRAPRTRAAAS